MADETEEAPFATFGEKPRLHRPNIFIPDAEEAAHYKAFQVELKEKEVSRVVAVAFSPAKPHRLAVVSGTKASIWQGAKASKEAATNLSKFKEPTQCVAWRGDGKLLLIGEASGVCSVVEMENHKVLRKFRDHPDAVTCCAFATADRSRAATGCRDGKLRIWDVATSDLLRTVDAHCDCMKVVVPGAGGSDVWITAGYDGKVCVWDLRTGAADDGEPLKPVLSLDHGSPVEAGVAFPGGALFASAGGTEVKVWDVAGGGRCVETLSDAHSKVVTSVCLDPSASVLLTASFDGHAKVYQASSMQHLWTYKFPGPITCASWRPDGKALAVGMENGQWQTRVHRSAANEEGEQGEKKGQKRRAPQGGQRGRGAAASDDEVVEVARQQRKRSATKLDYLLRKFEYKKLVVYIATNPHSVSEKLAIIEELLQRGDLEKAFSEIGEALCFMMLRWLCSIFGKTRDALSMELFMEALHTLLDNNTCLQPPSNSRLRYILEVLERKVNSELYIQKMVMSTSGMLKTITA